MGLDGAGSTAGTAACNDARQSLHPRATPSRPHSNHETSRFWAGDRQQRMKDILQNEIYRCSYHLQVQYEILRNTVFCCSFGEAMRAEPRPGAGQQVKYSPTFWSRLQAAAFASKSGVAASPWRLGMELRMLPPVGLSKASPLFNKHRWLGRLPRC